MKSMNKLFIISIIIVFSLIAYNRVKERDSEKAYKVLATHPFDASVYTQGLEISDNGRLLIAAGYWNESAFGYLEEGKFEEVYVLPDEEFGEGLTETDSAVWMLTWKDEKAYRFNRDNFEMEDRVEYKGEGWGLAFNADDDVLYMSNGSSKITVRNPETFAEETFFEVFEEGESIGMLNELEYANGHLYANIYLTNEIVKINPKQGKVVHRYDFTDLVEELSKTVPDLNEWNGIAHIEGKRFLVTGKNYPIMYEVELN